MSVPSRALVLSAAALLAVTACTDPMQQPLVLDGPRTAAFVQDEAECRQIVEQGLPVDAGGRVLGSTAGAAATTAVFGGDARDVAAGAAIGMISGAISGEQAGKQKQRSALISCMRGRGHPVIG